MAPSASASAEGTHRYAERFAGRVVRRRSLRLRSGQAPQVAEGHFRIVEPAGGLVVSSIGIGTYLGAPDAPTDQAYTEAVVAAVSSGMNVIDSAINYRFQRSERSLGAALRQLFAAGFQRDELVVCTKGGYLTPDGEMPRDPSAYFRREYFERGVLTPGDVAAGCHAMTPRFLDDQLRRSLGNLGVEAIDVYYLHNPETQLADVSREEFHARLRAAFGFLESAAAAGRIRWYGMATWNAFRQGPAARDYLSLAEMAGLARDVAGEAHRFRFVQLPFNLAMPEALLLRNQTVNQRGAPMVEAASAFGITLIGSASLLQGQLTRNLPAFVAQALGLDSDLHRALQFARSAPGITTALVGISRKEHVEANLELLAHPPASREQLEKLFQSAG